jgi:hypothetical protein
MDEASRLGLIQESHWNTHQNLVGVLFHIVQ